MPYEKSKEVIEDPSTRNVYCAPVAIATFGSVAAITPDWSQFYWKIVVGNLIISVIWLFIGYLRKKHLNIRWHAFTMIATFNMAGIYCLMIFFRVQGEPLWLLFLLIGLYGICFAITFRFRKIVIIGVYSPRSNKTIFGRIFYISSFIILALSGGGSYGRIRVMQETIGYSETMYRLSHFVVVVGFILIIAIQGLWMRFTNPDFDIKKYT